MEDEVEAIVKVTGNKGVCALEGGRGCVDEKGVQAV